jgi:hypothetical protein
MRTAIGTERHPPSQPQVYLEIAIKASAMGPADV